MLSTPAVGRHAGSPMLLSYSLAIPVRAGQRLATEAAKQRRRTDIQSTLRADALRRGLATKQSTPSLCLSFQCAPGMVTVIFLGSGRRYRSLLGWRDLRKRGERTGRLLSIKIAKWFLFRMMAFCNAGDRPSFARCQCIVISSRCAVSRDCSRKQTMLVSPFGVRKKM